MVSTLTPNAIVNAVLFHRILALVKSLYRFRDNLKVFVLEIFGWFILKGYLRAARLLSLALSRNSFTPKILDFTKSSLRIEDEANKIRSKIENARLSYKDSSRPTDKPLCEIKARAHFVRPKDDSLTSEVLRNLSDSFSRHVGESLLVFDDASKIVPNLLSRGTSKTEDEKLDFIFFELHSLISLPPNSLISQLENLKSSNLYIFILCFDVWRETDRNLIRNWKGSHTTFLHMDNTISDSGLQKNSNLMHWFFVGHFSELQNFNHAEKKIFFSGNIKTSDRRAWLLNLIRAARYYSVHLDLKLFSYKRRNKIRQSYDDFIKSMSSSMFIFSLSQKSGTHTLITFRSIEAFALGRVLIQQELPNSQPLRSFFVPYFEYLPFNSPEELGACLYLIRHEPSLFQDMGRNALKKWEEFYSPEKAWGQLLGSITR